MSLLRLITGRPSSSNTESAIQHASVGVTPANPLAITEDMKNLAEKSVIPAEKEAIAFEHRTVHTDIPGFGTDVEQVSARMTNDVPIPWLHINQPMTK